MDTGKYHLLGNCEHNLPHAPMIVLPQKIFSFLQEVNFSFIRKTQQI